MLSGVARTQARFACGKTLIAQMLCGSGSEKVKKLRLNRLTTFGLLAHLTQPEAAALIDALIGAGCLEQTELDRFRPVVRLTDLGAEVMRGTRPLDAPLAIPESLLRKLRVPRPDPTARPSKQQAGSVPGPVVRPAATSEPPATRRPAPADDAGPPEGWIENDSPGIESILRRGIGPGPGALLACPAVPNDHRGKHCWTSRARPKVSWRPEITKSPSREIEQDLPASALHTLRLAQRPSYYWTWRLLSTGFAVAECAAIRGIEPEAALDHALRAVEEGWPLEARQCLPPELLAAMEAVVGPDEPEQIRPLLAKLPPGTPRAAVELFLRCRRRRQEQALRGGE